MPQNTLHGIVFTNKGILSSAVNVLRKRLKKFDVCKTDFCNSITFTVITEDDKGALIKIEPVFPPVSQVVCRGVFRNGRFYTFIKTRLSVRVISEIHKLSGSAFVENLQNFM